MEKRLVSFGNYLLKKCNVKGYDLDGNQVLERLVTDADICNWKEEYLGEDIPEKYHAYLPSRYNVGEEVKVCLMPEGVDTFPGFPAKVIAIHFTNSKVKYDLEFKFYGDYCTRIYNIDSILILDKD